MAGALDWDSRYGGARAQWDGSEELVTATFSFPGLFIQHPIAPIEGSDPLASFDPDRWQPGGMVAGSVRPRIGYGCLWEPVPERTESGSAWHLREAMLHMSETVDIGVQLSGLARTTLKAIHTRYRGGRLTTSWCYSQLTDAYVLGALRRGISSNSGDRRIDAVLMIDALTILQEPFFTYYASSWDALISSACSAERYAALRRITPANMQRRRERELSVYERATGVIAQSHWLRRSLIEQSGIPPEKIHVVPPAIVAGKSEGGPVQPLREREAPRRKLLFVGRQYEVHDFYRKGGDLAVAALGILRRDYDPQITLTIVGMEKWPLHGGPPEGVNLLGVLPPSEVVKLYDSHDLFVMPSRQEPFGLVFVEALSRGMPCVARNAYAMPEIVTPGVSGGLIDGDDVHELATTIATILADDEVYKECYARAPQIAAYFSWDRAARDIVQIITENIGG